MQCKSGCAQAGQNKKRRANARLSWDGVGKSAVGRGGLLLQHGLDDVDFLTVLFDDLALVVPLIIDSSAINLNVLGGFDIQLSSTVQLVLNSLLALTVVVGVQIGMAGNSVGVLALVQLLDGVLSDAGAYLSGIDNTGGEEIVDAAAGEHGSTCNSNSGQTCDLQERTTRQNHGSILLINKNHSTN